MFEDLEIEANDIKKSFYLLDLILLDAKLDKSINRYMRLKQKNHKNAGLAKEIVKLRTQRVNKMMEEIRNGNID